MGKKTRRQKTTAADLPDEIVRREILTRLPIKSAVRFKCVSKSWLSLFTDPQFVKAHHTNHSTLNPNEHDRLIADKGTKLVMLSRYEETKMLPLDSRTFLIGSINGIVCLRRDNNISLWNPAIHLSKEFIFRPHCYSVYGYDMGLGFDHVSNNFKVVVLSNDLLSATVYCSGLNSWSEMFIPDNVFPKTKSGFDESSLTVIAKGCPHWTFSRYTFEKGTLSGNEYMVAAFLRVVKFDVESNEFILLPEFYFDVGAYEGGYEFCHQFVDMKDSLTLIVHNRHSVNCVLEIFSLAGKDGCCVWSKMYTLGPLQIETQGWYVALSQGFKDDGEFLYHDNGMFSCMDHNTEVIKRLRGTTSTDYEISCFRYEPTLCFIHGMKSVHLTTQSRTRGCFRTPRRLINSLRD